MSVQDQVLDFLRVTGPTIPAKVAKAIGTEIFLASAHLADLSSQGKVKVSKLKIGGSPLYYLAGQEEKIYNFAAGNLNAKDLNVLNNLKQNKILREADLDLLYKVALRNLKDFAIPLNVRTREGSELFWKWHLLSQEETNTQIANIIRGPQPIAKPVVEKEEFTSEPEVETVPETVEEKQEETSQEQEEEAPVLIEEPNSEDEKVSETDDLISEKPKEDEQMKEGKRVIKKEEQAKLTPKPVQRKPKPKPKPRVQEEIVEEKKPLLEKVKEKVTRKVRRKAAPDKFLPVLQDFFRSLEIQIDEHNIIRKNSEINFQVKVPSVVGRMTHFCKAKKKQRCDEKDISAAYMEAMVKKQPLLFLYTGELTKKAQEMIDIRAFENAVIKKIE
tara:strand:+ start:531 stop:1691 length:1161 start_codon:yes stop_codon:yes gene_type:complete